MEMEQFDGFDDGFVNDRFHADQTGGPDGVRMRDIKNGLSKWSHPNRYVSCFMPLMEEAYTAARREQNANRLKCFFVASAFFFMTSAAFRYVSNDSQVYAAYLLGACLTLMSFSFMYVQAFVDHILMYRTPMFIFSVVTLLGVSFMVVVIASVEQDHSPPVNMMLIIFACYGFNVLPRLQLTLIMTCSSACWAIYLWWLGSVHKTHLFASFFALGVPNLLGAIYSFKTEALSRQEFSTETKLQAALTNNELCKDRFGQFRYALVPPLVEQQQQQQQQQQQSDPLSRKHRVTIYRGATVCVLRVHDPTDFVVLQSEPNKIRDFVAPFMQAIEEKCAKHNINLVQMPGDEDLVFVGNVPSSAQVGHSNMFRAISEIMQALRNVFMEELHMPPLCRAGIGSGQISVGYVGGSISHASFAISGAAIDKAKRALQSAISHNDDSLTAAATTTTVVAAAAAAAASLQMRNPFDEHINKEHVHAHDPWSPFADGARITNDVVCIDQGVRNAIHEMCSEKTTSQVNAHMQLVGRENALVAPTFIVTQHHSLVCIMDDCEIPLIYGHVLYTPPVAPTVARQATDNFLNFNDPGVVQAVQSRYGQENDDDDYSEDDSTHQAREPLHVMDATDMDALLGNMMKERVSMETRGFLSLISPFFSRVHTINLGNGKLRRLTLDAVCSNTERYWRIYRMRYAKSTALWGVLGFLMLLAFGVLDVVVFLEPVRSIIILRFVVAPTVFISFLCVGLYCRTRPKYAARLWRVTQVVWLVWFYLFVFGLYIVAPAEDTLYGGPRLVATAIYVTLFMRVPFSSFLRYIVWIPLLSFSALRIAYAATKERKTWLAVDTSPALIFQLIATTVIMYMVSYVTTNDDERFFIKFRLYDEAQKSLLAIQTQLRQLLTAHLPPRFVECIIIFNDRENEVFRHTHAALLQIFVECASLVDEQESSKRIEEFIRESPFEKISYCDQVYTLIYQKGKRIVSPSGELEAYKTAYELYEGIRNLRNHRNKYKRRYAKCDSNSVKKYTLSCRAGFAIGTVFQCLLGVHTKNVTVWGSASRKARAAWSTETDQSLFPREPSFQQHALGSGT
jgi:class 3 adenylate cyclase